ncbi:MAG: hypothetical protein IIU78_00435 [Alistipes sp.]|nr:hypothetical protein [Alistipes sp.]
MTVFLFPTEMEAELFVELCPDADVVISGVGIAATAATLSKLYAEKRIDNESVVILAGLAGSYIGGLEKGDVVEVVEEQCAELPERFQRRYSVEPYTNLCRVRSNSVHGKGAEASGAEVENMEGAALFALAEVLGFRAVEIRAISNYVGEEFTHWMVYDALNALADELVNYYE